MLDQTSGNDLLAAAVRAGSSFLAARLGSSELGCVAIYLDRRAGHARHYPSLETREIHLNAGVFPPSGKELDLFCEAYLEAIRLADTMGVWGIPTEARVLREYCPSAELVQPRALEPYYHTEPWSAALAGRRVLVIHPFAESIRENYRKNRERIFADPHVLPQFDLQVLKAVQSIAGRPTEFRSWSDALASMKAAMETRTFDVCVVGAGAYGLPLAAHAKFMGKQAIHMGGASQILFGIRGRRWDEHEVISTLYNEYWTRPRVSETPKSAAVVEGGCYW